MNQQQQQQGVLPPPAPVQGRNNRGGGNRRGPRPGGGNRQRRNADVGGQLRQPGLPDLNGAPPRPTHLATSSTPERNDPLWLDGVSGAELQPKPEVQYLYSGAEALPMVTSVVHQTLTSSARGYAQRISESMLSYYACVLVWARMLAVHIGNGLPAIADERYFVEQVASLNLEVPPLLAHYLSGIGNTRMPLGRDMRFRLPNRRYQEIDEFPGFFGRVSVETQPLYQAYPCLAVCFHRILADLAENVERWWSIDAIAPEIEGAVDDCPSLAMIGYGPKARLTTQQVDLLASSDILIDEHHVFSNPSLPLNISLLLAIHAEMAATGRKLHPVPTGLVGSQAQLGLVTFESEFAPLADRPVVLHTPYTMPKELSFASSAFVYRARHSVDELVDQVAPWVVWRHGVDVAADYAPLAMVGNQFRNVEPDILGLTEFRTTQYLLRARIEAFEAALNRAA